MSDNYQKNSNDSNSVSNNPNNNYKPKTFRDLIVNMKNNFLRKEVEIIPGLVHNQYEIIKRIYFYSHNQFMSGPFDENGEPKYFYDLVTDRNDQATKNIDLDTKDCYIKSEGGGYLRSRLLRLEFMGYAKTTGFGMKLNKVADDLPDFGTVVWKKIKNKEGRTDVVSVDLINIINDPVAENLKDSPMIERCLLTQSDLEEKRGVWRDKAIDSIIKSGKTVRRSQFMTETGASAPGILNSSIDDSTPFYEVYEFWGEIPYAMYQEYEAENGDVVNLRPSHYGSGESPEEPKKPEEPSDVNKNINRMVYVQGIVGGIDDGSHCENVLYCKEVDREQFIYKEVHYRRRKGRWLGVGNYELLFPLIEKANELTNRFFSSLRIALMHLYQTRDKNHISNVLTDLLDGDLIVTKSEITIIPTEVRGAADFRDEMARIERRADGLCNSYEVVSGADLPSGTPFKLGQQQLTSATKLFKYIQQNIGLFLEQVFNEWLLPDFAASLIEEHILDLMDDPDDLELYYKARARLFQFQVLKEYIMQHGEMPDPEQLALVGSLIKDQLPKGPKQLQIEKAFYANQKYTLKTVTTGENEAKAANNETLLSSFNTLAANPAALQDPRLMKIYNMMLEANNISPVDISSINLAPTNPSLNPANQGGGGADRMAGAGGGESMPMEMNGGGGRGAQQMMMGSRR